MVFVIAEAGVNHNGDLRKARRLISEAVAVGADAVKFQTFRPEALDPPGSRREMLESLTLSHEDHERLKAFCDRLGIEFMSTPFDVGSLRFLHELGVKTLKIASGNLSNFELLSAAKESGLRLVVSTGMSTLDEVRGAFDFLQTGVFLHCVSAYPAPMAEMNLRAIQTMRGLGCDVGLSDHSMGIACPIAAVALGATVIEKHFTLSRNLPGPDHKASLEPTEFARMVSGIRDVEAALGDGEKRPMLSEKEVIGIAAERAAWRSR